MTELLMWGAAGLGLTPGFLVPTGAVLPFTWVPTGLPRVGRVGKASPYCSEESSIGPLVAVTELMVG